MENNYKRTIAGSVGAGMEALFNASGRKYYILEHKTESKYHRLGESQKIIVDQIELGRDSSCQVRFDESMETVSRRHAAIVRDGENYKLIPMSQTNATLVNGQPVVGEWHLNSGDEIRLSSRGPLMGFIIPQGKQSLVKSIGLTERMSLFRQQALRPYKRALWIMTIVFILAIASLVAWNLYQAKQYETRLADTQAQIDATTDEIKAKDAEIQDLVIRIDSNKAASEQELEATKEALEQARAAQRSLINKHSALQADMESIKEEMESKPVDNDNTTAAVVAEEKQAPTTTEEVTDTKVFFSDIEDCMDAVYYIKMNDISVYDKDTNAELYRFATNHLIGGTGFLLDDGRFVTANRTIEPWYHYIDTKVGESGSHTVRLGHILALAKYGHKVVATFTAYSRTGNNFNFRNTDMRSHVWRDTDDIYLESISIKVNDYTWLKLGSFGNIQVRSGAPKYDWATMAKRDQLAVVKGLEFSNETSIMPKATTEVAILGFPTRDGYTDSHEISPINRPNNINVTGLNDEQIIELASKRYNPGNDGAPVLQKVNGKWVVIGILCHTDSADRDCVVPIINTTR